MSDLPPRVGPYRVLRLLAQGGMGSVYLAQDKRLGRVVALKMVHADLAKRAEARAQFFVEARATARLAHPNVVPVFDVGEQDGAPWAAYEFVEGRTLKQRLREGPLPPHDARRVMSEIASAVEVAHADGIVHRDLKPSNIVLGTDGRARVLDFGIARLLGSADSLEDFAPALDREDPEGLEMLGTPSYMAPEQWCHEDDAAADVWALGLLTCEVFLGTHPLSGRPTVEIVTEIGRRTPLPMPPGFDALPATLQALIRACVEKDPTLRPSASEVVASLRALDETGPATSVAHHLDADTFRARTRALSALEERVRRSPWTLVVGPTGAGKSALVHAYAARNVGPVISVDAGTTPFTVLAQRFHDARLGADDDPTWIDGLAESDEPRPRSPVALAAWLHEAPERVALVLSELAASTPGQLLFVVDRLEALVGGGAADDAGAFSAALFALALSSDERVRIVATVDEGALGRLPTPLFASASVMRLERPGAEELRAIALEALAEAGARVTDPDELDEVAELLATDPCSLPLLRFVLLDAWRRRDASGRVSFEPFCGTGATTILARYADAAFDALPERDRAAARELLVQLSLGATRTPPQTPLVEALVRGGLARRDVEGRLDLTHPSLPTAWRRLARWIAEHDGHAWIAREAAEAHVRWVERGQSDDDLLRGRVLLAARAALEHLPASAEVADFVRASVRVEQRTRARWRALRAGFAIAALLAVVGLVGAVWLSRRRAEDAEQARATSERDRAELLARSARLHWESGDVRSARAQLRRSLELGDTLAGRVLHAELALDPERWRARHAGFGYDVAIDEQGRSAFVAWQSGELSRFDLATGEELRIRASDDQLLAAVALPDGRVATGDAAGHLAVWSAHGGGLEPATVARFERGILRLVRAGRGAVVASLLGGEVRLVPLDDASLDAGPHEGAGVVELGETAQGIVWERDHFAFAATTSGRVLRLDFSSGAAELVATVGGAQSMARASASTLAIGGVDGRLHLVDHLSGATRSRPVVRGRVRTLTALAGGELLVGSLDGELVRVSDGGVHPLPSESAAVVGLAVRDGLAVLALGNGARAFDWGSPPRPRLETNEPVLNVAVGADAVYWTSRETIIESDRSTGAERRRFVPFQGARDIRALLLGPGGDRLAASFGSLGVAIVDLQSGAPVAFSFEGSQRIMSLRPHGDGLVYGTTTGELVHIGWDGSTHRVATGGAAIGVVESLGPGAVLSGHLDGRVLLTEADAPSRELRRFPRAPVGIFAHGVQTLVLLEDGALHRLESDGTWRALESANVRIYRAALAADGSRLVAPGADGALHHWSLPDGALRVLPLARRELNVVALDETGSLAAVGGDDGIARFVNLRDGSSPWARDPVSLAFTTELEEPSGRWRGESDGTLVRERDGSADEPFASAIPLPIIHLAFGPHDTLLVAQAAGHVELRHLPTRERIARARLRGEIVHVGVEGEQVQVRADTGHIVELDLSHLGAPRCALLRASWTSSPLSWVEGEARVEPPPGEHECSLE